MSRRLSPRGLVNVSLSQRPCPPDGLCRKCRAASRPRARSLRSSPRSNGLRDDEPRSQTRVHVAAKRSGHMDPPARPDPSEERREGSSFHGAAHDRRHPRPAWPHQGRSVPARNHHRRDAARSALPRVPSQSPGCRMSELTHVELLWIKKYVENRIRFGRIVESHVVDRQLRVVSFAAGSIFAFVRWAGNDYGTVESRIDILRAVAAGERYITVPYVRPGGESLLRISGWPKVEKVLQAIDAIEALGIDPADAAPDHWQHVHNRLSVGEQPRPYTQTRHQAWLRRRKLMS